MTYAFQKSRGGTVDSTTRDAVRELNLAFLILAKQLIAQDRESAMLTLGLERSVVDLISGLSPSQTVRMANSEMLLCSFRFDDSLLLNLLADHGRPESVAKTHAAIVALTKPVMTL
jgi:flagellar transcriptional activator FlhD